MRGRRRSTLQHPQNQRGVAKQIRLRLGRIPLKIHFALVYVQTYTIVKEQVWELSKGGPSPFNGVSPGFLQFSGNARDTQEPAMPLSAAYLRRRQVLPLIVTTSDGQKVAAPVGVTASRMFCHASAETFPRNNLRKGSQVRFRSPAGSCSKSGKSAASALPLLKNPGSDPNTRKSNRRRSCHEPASS